MFGFLGPLALKVGVPIITSIVGNVFGAEGLFREKKSGPQKEEFVVENVRPVVAWHSGAGNIVASEEQAMLYVKDVIKGIVALFNLIKLFRRSE